MMSNIAEIFTPCDPFKMTAEERQRLRWICKTGPALDGAGGIPPSRAGKRASNILRQIDRIETILHDVPGRGQRLLYERCRNRRGASVKYWKTVYRQRLSVVNKFGILFTVRGAKRGPTIPASAAAIPRAQLEKAGKWQTSYFAARRLNP